MMASNLLYFSHALKLRADAAQYVRRARTYPVGARRDEMRRIARAQIPVRDGSMA